MIVRNGNLLRRCVAAIPLLLLASLAGVVACSSSEESVRPVIDVPDTVLTASDRRGAIHEFGTPSRVKEVAVRVDLDGDEQVRTEALAISPRGDAWIIVSTSDLNCMEPTSATVEVSDGVAAGVVTVANEFTDCYDRALFVAVPVTLPDGAEVVEYHGAIDG